MFINTLAATQHLDRIMEGLIIGPESQFDLIKRSIRHAEEIRAELEAATDDLDEILAVLEQALTAYGPTLYLQEAFRLYNQLPPRNRTTPAHLRSFIRTITTADQKSLVVTAFREPEPEPAPEPAPAPARADD